MSSRRAGIRSTATGSVLALLLAWQLADSVLGLRAELRSEARMPLHFRLGASHEERIRASLGEGYKIFTDLRAHLPAEAVIFCTGRADAKTTRLATCLRSLLYPRLVQPLAPAHPQELQAITANRRHFLLDLDPDPAKPTPPGCTERLSGPGFTLWEYTR